MEPSPWALLIEQTYTVELGFVQIYLFVGNFVQTFRSGKKYSAFRLNEVHASGQFMNCPYKGLYFTQMFF